MSLKRKKWIESYELLGKALDRLEEAAIESPDEKRFIIDSAIQRFEFTIELLWKNLKTFLEDLGYFPRSPREVLQKAYAMGWIDNEKMWIGMLKDRNLTSHIYREELVDEIYKRVVTYYPLMRRLYEDMRENLPKAEGL